MEDDFVVDVHNQELEENIEEEPSQRNQVMICKYILQ
jgi:hypothetical protein